MVKNLVNPCSGVLLFYVRLVTMNDNVLALKFLEGDYYMLLSDKVDSRNQVDISIFFMSCYHDKEYQADVSIKASNPKSSSIHANIFVGKEDNLPSMNKLLAEVSRIMRQTRLFIQSKQVTVRFYRVGNQVATRKYEINIR